MGYRWKKEPKGQYKDGHEQEDVVAYWQNIFLPFIATLLPHMCKWDQNGALETIPEEAEDPKDPGPLSTLNGSPQHGQWIVIWVHDESTFYANDQRAL